jgi:hypothetical protein
MHILDINQDTDTMTIHHDGQEFSLPVTAWEHPESVAGEIDDLALVSPEVDGVRFSIHASGDAFAQETFVRVKNLDQAGIDALRERLERAGHEWKLTADGQQWHTVETQVPGQDFVAPEPVAPDTLPPDEPTPAPELMYRQDAPALERLPHMIASDQ